MADFACRERALIVEVDGATHSTDEEATYDARRTEYLEDSGWRVLRIMNDDVVRRMDDVLEMILSSAAR